MEWLIGSNGLLLQPWHWSVSGLALVLVLFLMNWLGRSFGISTAFKNMCSLVGAGKKYEFFQWDFKNESWRLIFALGAIVGGIISATLIANPDPIDISAATIQHLDNWHISPMEGAGFLPESIFNLSNPAGIILSILGGFMVGFGARYANGCTSGHAITGLSHLQLPSLLTVVGFFIGGLIMTWFIMPFIFA